MTEARLIVDPASISFRASGPATGSIVLMFGNIAFPSAGWNDFVIVVVEAWIGALLRLLRRASENERVHFMEGPYTVDISLLNEGALRLRASVRAHQEYAIAEVAFFSFVQSAMTAGDELLQLCQHARHESSDVDRLELALVALRQEVSRLSA